MNWKRALKPDPVERLLSEGQQWVVYHTLVDILNKKESDSDVAAAMTAIGKTESIDKIFAQQTADVSCQVDEAVLNQAFGEPG